MAKLPTYEELGKKVAEEALNNIYMGKTLREWIDAVKQTRWIPVSERLPEENGRYLVTNSAWGAMEVDWNAWVNGAWLYPNTKPIAWMPLPEPYKAESEDMK